MITPFYEFTILLHKNKLMLSILIEGRTEKQNVKFVSSPKRMTISPFGKLSTPVRNLCSPQGLQAAD